MGRAERVGTGHSRWREPVAPPREALLLLPQLPATATVLGRATRWSAPLNELGVGVEHPGTAGPAPDLVVATRVGDALPSGAALVLIDGLDRRGRLRRAGYQVQTYLVARAAAGAVTLAPLGSSLPQATRLSTAGPRQRLRLRLRLRAILVAAVRRATGRRYVTVAHRGRLTPAAVAAALGERRAAVLVGGGGGARRRSTFVVSGAEGPAAVVKVAPSRDRERGRREQQVLGRLANLGGGGRTAPRPLGEGLLGTLCWSAESALPGRPLPEVLNDLDAVRGQGLLEELAEWSTALAVSTRTDGTEWEASGSTLPLRGEHERFSTWRRELTGVPGVLVHGDVGTGGNVLVDGRTFGVIDWETARDCELPLTDLLPLLGLGLASGRSAAERPRYLARLCAGEEPESRWLLALVRSYCSRVGVPLERAGRLAGLAWGYQASMRLVHEELVAAAGGVPDRWTSPAEELARTWWGHPSLGLAWPALTDLGV